MKRILPVVIIIVIILGLGYFTLSKYDEYRSDKRFYGIYYGKNAPDFTLRDQDSNPVSLDQFKGKDVLLSFGYTSCPDICPTTLAKLNNIMDLLEDSKHKVQVLFITIDPERDTGKRLKEFIPYFNENFIGLTGNEEDIRKVANSYSVFYQKSNSGNSEAFYFMDHTQTVYLINQNGKLVLIYPFENLSPEKIVSDINRTFQTTDG
ncbi:MAG: SCO family protein [Thermodesulfobacteriota bacterium]